MSKKLTVIGIIVALTVGIMLIASFMTARMRDNAARIHADMENDPNWPDVRDACRTVYRLTKYKPPGELTSRDLKRIQFCKEFGSYSE